MGLDMYLNKTIKKDNKLNPKVQLTEALIESEGTYETLKKKLETQYGFEIPIKRYTSIAVDLFGKEYNKLKARIISGDGDDKELKAGMVELLEWSPLEIKSEVGYWRKFNALHGWFVTKVQEGVDDCGDYVVEKEHFLALEMKLETVMAYKNEDNSIIEEILPIQRGFFFGSTEYNDHYFSEVERTLTIVKGILKNWDEDSKYFDYVYRSSW